MRCSTRTSGCSSKADRLRVYKRVSPEETLVPMVLGVGIIEGTVENALYGLQYKTTAEMRKTMAFVHETIIDAAVLATIDVGTDADSFRYMGLGWRVTQTPSSGHLVKNRDVCLLESRGISIDCHGHKYGYHVLKSVDVASFPPFHATVATRSKMMQCTIFRHVSSNTISVYAKSVFNHAGSVPDPIAYNSFADSVLGVSKALDCVMAKQLTFLVLQGDDRTSSRPLDKQQTRNLLCLDKNKVPKSAVCSVCVRGPSLLTWHRTCKSCHQPTCSKCTTKVHVLATPHNLRIECCKVCVVASKEVRADPREPCPLLTLTEVERLGLEL